MGFASLLGNERLKENLTGSLRRGHISHFYLISGPEGSGKHTLARLLSAGILCREADRPCMKCETCRKVLSGVHPDVITVDDPEKKTVPVDLIRKARADIYVQPNEADYKIYMFPRAQDMGLPGQNALLKVLEEPPTYGVFLLLTDNPEKMLATVRSRCTELALSALSADVMEEQLRRMAPSASQEDIQGAVSRSGGFLGQAEKLLSGGSALTPQTEAFLASFAERDALGLVKVLVPMEKWKRDILAETLESWLELVEQALVCRWSGSACHAQVRRLSGSRSKQELTAAVGCLKKALDYTQANVSPAAVCGYLAWALR